GTAYGGPVDRAGEAVRDDDRGGVGHRLRTGSGACPDTCPGTRRTRFVHRLDRYAVIRQQCGETRYLREQGNRRTPDRTLGRGTHVGYSAAKRTWAMQPPGPFVLSRALLRRRFEKLSGPRGAGSHVIPADVRSSAAYSPGSDPGVPL